MSSTIECVLDFETASACDLRAAGAWRYAEDPTTEIICAAFIWTGLGQPALWLPEHGRDTELWDMAHNPNVIFIAHNAGFEKAIWRRIMVPVFGFPDIPNSRWRDTMASCAERVLPQQLDRALTVLRLPHQKDMEGSRITKALSKPNRRGYYDRSPEKLQRVYEYCRQDIRGEADLWVRLGPLHGNEHTVWLLDQRINERGIRLDMEFVGAAQRVVDRATIPLAKEFQALTGGLKFTQRDKIMQWLAGQGVWEVANLKKETLDEILGEEDEDDDSTGGYESLAGDDDTGASNAIALDPSVRRALSIRRLVGSASIKKLRRMAQCVCSDGRVRGTLQYHGAGPGRWAGRLLQPQNFPRGTLKKIKPAVAVEAIMTGDPEMVELLLGAPPVEAVLSSLRHAIIASPGRKIVAGDFAGIEARIVLALAGQHDKTALMASGADVYIDMALDIYKMPRFDIGDKALVAQFKEEHLPERMIGKNTVLGCGFQMGKDTFRNRYCPHQTIEFAEKVVQTYRRVWAPKVPLVWRGLEEAIVRTVHEGTPHEAYGVRYQLEDGWLTARLPSGRKLWYYSPMPTRKRMPWSTPEEPDVRRSYSYKAQKQGHWITIDGFGGLATENVVQALARDLMVTAMFKCEKEGLPIIMTVHDEIVAEPEENGPDEKVLAQIMADMPSWAKAIGVPVAAECWSGDRYKK